MAKQQRHGTEKGHIISAIGRLSDKAANGAGERIANWLNGPEDPGRRRVKRMLLDIDLILGSEENDSDSDGKKLAIVQTRLHKAFKSYTFFPMAWPLPGALILQWAPLAGPAGRFRGHWPPYADDYSEYFAVYELIALSAAGIRRLTNCSSCKRWYYAKFSHQRFCSVKCRERAFRSSAEWKAYRRKKARQYYWLHKNKNVK